MAMLEQMNAEAPPPAPVKAAPVKPAAKPAPTPAPVQMTLAAAKPQITEVLPPVIELQSDRLLESNETQVPVRYTVRAPGDAPVKDVKFRINGKLERDAIADWHRDPCAPARDIEAEIPGKPVNLQQVFGDGFDGTTS